MRVSTVFWYVTSMMSTVVAVTGAEVERQNHRKYKPAVLVAIDTKLMRLSVIVSLQILSPTEWRQSTVVGSTGDVIPLKTMESSRRSTND